ncbi:MAG TPA: endopeptidase La [Solirubrobacteraceae bacterium]|nr:endopeptidase La [Solirubrobacteraceae bacterium]
MIDVGLPEGGPREVTVGRARELPERAGVLPLRETVTFPDMLVPLNVGQKRSIELINDVLRGDRSIVMVASRTPELELPAPDDLYTVGVLGAVARMIRVPDGTLRVLIQGGQRVRIDSWLATEPYLLAAISELPDVVRPTKELEALMRNVQHTFTSIVQEVPYLPEELQLMVANVEDPGALANLIAGALRLKTDEKQELLEERDVAKRLRRLSEILARELEVVALGSKIQSQVQSELEKGQREYFLRQQLKAIQDELGEGDEVESEVQELRTQLAIELPEEVRKQADRELSRLARLQPAMAEYGVVRSYLEWIAALPWDTSTDDNLDLAHARAVLDEDHYDIEQVKDRILEFLAVRSLMQGRNGATRQPAGSILCFAGPPGVGKTSLGRSIARALGRRFERISVGGVRDEAEIRGHRRTYIGAMPGTIIRAMRDAGANNPLLMIDEIDKMGADFRGDPSSAMLEVLDPEQNHAFRDHYLDLPFDLSNAMFVATANTLDTVPGPLRDRMEVIQLAGYTEGEKLEIARRYLVPRQIERNGLPKSRISFSDAALKAIVADYTREAGVRQLEREIGSVCRKVARQVADGTLTKRISITEPRVRELLGRRRFFSETRRRTARPGVATGLAWTPVGGEVLFVEATAMPGKGGLTITGQLGDVMRESAQAALSWVRSAASELAPELPDDWFATHDLHIHVPAGATPKDGPSAGVTIATALASLLSGRPVRSDVAMTGEITLTGQVLPIGGLKEKALAAQRSGIKTVIAPKRNQEDIEEIAPHLRAAIEFRFVEEIDEMLEIALARPRRSGVTKADAG